MLWGSCKNRRYGGKYRLSHQGDKNRRATNNVSEEIYFLFPWWWWWHVPPTHRYTRATRHNIQETTFFIIATTLTQEREHIYVYAFRKLLVAHSARSSRIVSFSITTSGVKSPLLLLGTTCHNVIAGLLPATRLCGSLCLLAAVSSPAPGPAHPPIPYVPGAISPGVTRSLCEADHPPPSDARVKNVGVIPPLPILLSIVVLKCLRNKHGKSFRLTNFHVPQR
jgi:hypothetical protein